MGISLNPLSGLSFFTDPNRWMTPGEHATRRKFESLYQALAPQPMDTSWIQDWSKGAGEMAQKGYERALSETLQRVAPGIAGRGMWGSPGVRGALQIQAAAPLQQNLAQQLMGIQTQEAQMTGQAQQAYMQDVLNRLRMQMEVAGGLGGLGVKGSDIFGGLGALGGSLVKMLPWYPKGG